MPLCGFWKPPLCSHLRLSGFEECVYNTQDKACQATSEVGQKVKAKVMDWWMLLLLAIESHRSDWEIF